MMDEMLSDLSERIEKARGQLYKTRTRTALIMVSRRMDSLINLYMRLSAPSPDPAQTGPPFDPEDSLPRTAAAAGFPVVPPYQGTASHLPSLLEEGN